jgi:hypothetical protein
LGDASLSPALPLSRPSGRVRFTAVTESWTPAAGPALSAAGVAQSIKPLSSSSQQVPPTILRI